MPRQILYFIFEGGFTAKMTHFQSALLPYVYPCTLLHIKFTFEITPKNGFSGFCQKFLQAMDKVENFLATFQISGSLRIQLWIVLKCVKKYYKHCILLLSLLQSHGTVNLRIPICRSSYYYIDGNTMGDNTWRTYAFRELDQNISPLNISDLSAIRLVFMSGYHQK